MARVLVIDDEPRIVSFVSRALVAGGLGVDSAYDGEAGLAMAQSGIYDLVILDLLVPRLDGFAVLRTIMATHPQQRVLVLSALGEVNDKVQCLTLGAADYLVKPFSLAELMARVGVRLRERTTRAPEPPTTVAGVSLDRNRRLADSGHGPVHLSQHELQLLQHLIDHAGEVCTREQLLADVWGYCFDPGSNVVEVYVSRLRAKLGKDVIETVRHVGYSLRRD
jgi:DNA-binding response OmpR family regulator